MANFPADCNIGDTFFFDYPLLNTLNSFWVADYAQLIGTVTPDTLVQNGSPVAFRNSNYAYSASVIRATGFSAAASQLFTTFQFTVNFNVKQRGANSGSFGTGYVKIGPAYYIRFAIGATNIFTWALESSLGFFDILAAQPDAAAVGTQPFDLDIQHTFKVVRDTPTSSIFKLYFDGVLKSTYDTGTSGAKSIYMQPMYYNNSADWDAGANNSHKVNYSFLNIYLIGTGLSNPCLGRTPDPWPEVVSKFPGDPAACALGKNTTYFLEEFETEALAEDWVQLLGTYNAVNGYLSAALEVPAETKIELGWVGKILNWAPSDVLSIQISGRLDSVNLGIGTDGYDAFGIKVGTPDLLNWVQLKLRRDTSNPLIYYVRASESFGVERTIQTPSFSGYPFEMNLRIDITTTGVEYYVDDVLLASINWPGTLDVSYMIPRIFVGCDNVHRGYLYHFYVSGSPGFPNLCDGAPTQRIAMYQNEMISFLPFGALWVNLNRYFRLFLQAFAVELSRIHDSALTLIRESNPGDSTLGLLLPRWEETLLLPEEMPTGIETEVERQRVVNAKLLTPGGQSRAYFRELAANLGLSIEITERGYWVPARVGVARVGRARTSEPGSVFYWNIRFVIDNFDGPTVYWAYDGDEDFTTYPGYFAARVGVFSSYISFQGGPLAPTWPVVGFVDPITVAFTARAIYSGAGNQSFFLVAWADSETFTGDYVFFNFTYIPSSASYVFDLFGTQNGAPYTAGFDTGIRLIPDATFDFLIRILPTGFEISIPALGAFYAESGFNFPNLKYLDFNLQRASATLQGMLSSLGISSDAQVAKFKAIVERTKPAHTVVTYT